MAAPLKAQKDQIIVAEGFTANSSESPLMSAKEKEVQARAKLFPGGKMRNP